MISVCMKSDLEGLLTLEEIGRQTKGHNDICFVRIILYELKASKEGGHGALMLSQSDERLKGALRQQDATRSYPVKI